MSHHPLAGCVTRKRGEKLGMWGNIREK